MDIKKKITQALGLHRSMAMGGEQPSASSEAMFNEAVSALRGIDSLAVEAMAVVDKINDEISSSNDLVTEDMPYPHLSLWYSGTCCGLTFEGYPIWDSENEGTMYDDNDQQLPLEGYVRKKIAERLSTLRMVEL